MNGINKVILVGNLGKEPEIHNFDNGRKKATFSLATNESFRDKENNWQTQTEWHNIVGFGSVADRIEKRLKKGSLIYLEGKLRTRNWEDKDGNKRYTTEIYMDNFSVFDASVTKKEDSNDYAAENISAGNYSGSAPADDLPF